MRPSVLTLVVVGGFAAFGCGDKSQSPTAATKVENLSEVEVHSRSAPLDAASELLDTDTIPSDDQIDVDAVVDSDADSADINLSGTWKGTVKSRGMSSGVTFVLKHDGKRLSGKRTQPIVPGGSATLDLTESKATANSRTYVATLKTTQNGDKCSPATQTGTLVLNMKLYVMTGTVTGRDTNCRSATHTFSLASTPALKTWVVTQSGSVLRIGYGSGGSFPQFAALHRESGFLRMNFGPTSGWGTSVVVLPSLWSKGKYYQGAPTSATWRTVGTDLVISFSARISTLGVQGQIRLTPPTGDSLTAVVSASVDGTVALDARPGEAFKPVFLSSMNISQVAWDASSGFIGARSLQLPSEGWIVQPPMVGTLFGLNGGTSGWKKNAPTVEVTMDRRIEVTGWVKQSTDPNDDNVGFWAASSRLLRSWQYHVRARRP
jgi:hypothetical protein